MSELIDFYRDGFPNSSGDTLQSIIEWDDDSWESCHHFIQWVFPLDEPSQYNPNAPLLTEEDIEEFKNSEVIKSNIGKVLNRAKWFLGFYDDVRPHWFEVGDHNMLRITRILRFLNLIGNSFEMMKIYSWLTRLDSAYPYIVSDETIDYWMKAVNGPNFNVGLFVI